MVLMAVCNNNQFLNKVILFTVFGQKDFSFTVGQWGLCTFVYKVTGVRN